MPRCRAGRAGLTGSVMLWSVAMFCTLFAVGTPYVFEVHESLERLGAEVVALVANVPPEVAPWPHELGEVIPADRLTARHLESSVFIPLLTPGHRHRLRRECRDLGFTEFATIVDPTAVLPHRVELAHGVHVNAAAVVGSRARLGAFAMVNRGASVGHDAVVEAYATLGPGCVLCGSVTIGRGAFIGAGAVITPRHRVGANAIVGAGAVVVRDVPERAVVVGNPARVVREGGEGYGDVSVEP